MMGYDLHLKAVALVKDAGGRLVGRIRLQKVAYLTQLAGYVSDFPFEYRHCGPYSEELAEAMEITVGLGIVRKEETVSVSGSWHSIYRTERTDGDQDRARFISAAAETGAIELELPATDAYLYVEEGFRGGHRRSSWTITAQRKPHKAAEGRLERAKTACRRLCRIATPGTLLAIA